LEFLSLGKARKGGVSNGVRRGRHLGHLIGVGAWSAAIRGGGVIFVPEGYQSLKRSGYAQKI